MGSTYANYHGEVVKIKETTIHPNYNAQSGENDLAILTLARPVNFTNKVQPVYNPILSDVEVLLGGNLSGYGLNHINPIIPRLQQVYMNAVDNNQCNETYNGALTYDKICGKTVDQNTKRCGVSLE